MSKPREWWIHPDRVEIWEMEVNAPKGSIQVIEYSAYEKAVEALREILDHVCDGGGDKPCSQMWFQDVAETTLRELGELKDE